MLSGVSVTYGPPQSEILDGKFQEIINSSVLNRVLFLVIWASLEVQTVKNLPAMQETWVRSLSPEDLLEKEILQYSCLENPVGRGAWWATIHGIAKSPMRLRD